MWQHSHGPLCEWAVWGIRPSSNATGGIYMQTARHPTYGETTIVCACGATYPTRSTLPQLRVAVCAACHPWWTGRQKLVDTAGRVEKFQRRYTRDNAHNEERLCPSRRNACL